MGAQRELREEAGVEASDWREIARVHVSNSVTDEEATLFLATGLSHGPSALESTELDLTLDWVPFEEALAMVMDGRITDALSVVALQRVALARLAPPRLHFLGVGASTSGSGPTARESADVRPEPRPWR